MSTNILVAWRKIRTISWFLYGKPETYLYNLDSMSWIIMKVSFDT